LTLRRRRRLLWCASGFCFACVALDALAWLHVGAMTQWTEETAPTDRPEELGLAYRMGVLLTGVSVPRPVNRPAPEQVGLPFETHRLDPGHGKELEARCVPAPGGKLLTVLFHGYVGHKDSMLGPARALSSLGSHVLMVDFYGSGGSTGTGTAVGIEEARDVAAAVAYCRAQWPDQALLLYGQSMGGAAILRAIAEHDVDPDGLVIESTFDRLLSTVKSRFHRMHLPATPTDADAFAHNPATYARAVHCPTLVLQGAQDPNIFSEQAQRVQAALQGWKRLSLYDKVGHQDILSASPEAWNRDVADLLEVISRDLEGSDLEGSDLEGNVSPERL
jgi:pimeloyl-ACP methyl ester carboxylesterase